MSELHDDIRRLNKEVEDLENRIEELEQQNKELIKALNIALNDIEREKQIYELMEISKKYE